MKLISEYLYNDKISSIDEYLMNKSTKDKPAEEYYEDPPMTISQAVNRLDKTGRVYWEAQQKMKAWNEGRRKENIRACKDEKLIMFWDICSKNNYRDQLEALEDEANCRGWTFKKIKRN